MPKRKLNVTMEENLIEYAKAYAAEQKTTVSEVFTRFVMDLKRRHEDDPMKMLLDDPEFLKSLTATMARIEAVMAEDLRNRHPEVKRSFFKDTAKKRLGAKNDGAIAHEIIGSWKGEPLKREEHGSYEVRESFE